MHTEVDACCVADTPLFRTAALLERGGRGARRRRSGEIAVFAVAHLFDALDNARAAQRLTQQARGRCLESGAIALSFTLTVQLHHRLVPAMDGAWRRCSCSPAADEAIRKAEEAHDENVLPLMQQLLISIEAAAGRHRARLAAAAADDAPQGCAAQAKASFPT